MVAEPTPTAETKPAEDTVATLVLLLLHVTVWFVALDGFIVTVSCSVVPFKRENIC